MVVGAICQEMVGTKLIQPDDAASWTRLQIALLVQLVALLKDLQRRLLDETPAPAKAREVATAGLRVQW